MATYQFRIRDDKGTITFGTDQVQNWQDIAISLTRSTVYKGILRGFTNQFTFVDDIRTRIINTFDIYGVNGETYFTIWKGNNSGDASSFVKLNNIEFKADYETINIEELTCSINFVDSSFQEKLLSRDKEKVLYTNTVGLDGNEVELKDSDFIDTILTDRKINEDNKLSGFANNSDYINTQIRASRFSFPVMKDYADDVGYADSTFFAYNERADAYPPAESLFYANNSGLSKVIDFKFTLNMTLKIDVAFDSLAYPSISGMSIVLRHLGENNEELGTFFLYDDDITVIRGESYTYEVNKNTSEQIDVSDGDKLYLYIYFDTNFNPPDPYFNDFVITNNETIINASSTSEAKRGTTETLSVRPHELFTKLVELYTGEKDAFYSELFGRTDLGYPANGEWANLAVLNGKMVRGFAPVDSNLEFNLRDAFEAYNSITNMVAFIDIINGKQVFRIEPYEYIFNQGNSYDIGSNISDIKRVLNPDKIYGGITNGYKTFTLDEANGIELTHGELSFTTPLKVDKNKDLKCKWITDGYPLEFARRKSFIDFPTDDTRYDKELFIVDFIRRSTIILQRQYLTPYLGKYFEQVNGIPNPDEAYNLRISPKRNLQRHLKTLNEGLVKNINDSLIFGSISDSKTLSTQLSSSDDFVTEIEDIKIADIERPIMLEDDFEMNISVVDENILNNKNEVISFTYAGTKLYGYIDSLDLNLDDNTANLKLFRANR